MLGLPPAAAQHSDDYKLYQLPSFSVDPGEVKTGMIPQAS